MTPEDASYRFRLRTLALAEELGSVHAACRAMAFTPRSAVAGSGSGTDWS